MSLGSRVLAMLGVTMLVSACSHPQRPPSCPSSAASGALEGDVVDAATNGKLARATVVATSASAQPVTAQTDENGRYRICGLTPGTYTVTFYNEDTAIERTGIEIGSDTLRYPTVRIDRQLSSITHVDVAVPQWDDARGRDCTPATVVKARSSSAATFGCGAIDRRHRRTRDEAVRGDETIGRAKQCVADAVATGREFAFSEISQGIDSEWGVGYFATRDDGTLRVFEVFYDSDPCGGSCPWDGGATIRECKALVPTTSAKKCANGHTLVDCFECRDAREVEHCRRGEKPITKR